MSLLCLISNCAFLEKFSGMWLVQVFVSLFFAVLFLQSSLDKVFDWNGNISWLKEHFANSPFKNIVPLITATLTVSELAAGALSLLGAGEALFFKTYCFAFAGTVMASVSFLMLFMGQRLAKDYAGAVSIASYFVIAVIDLYILT